MQVYHDQNVTSPRHPEGVEVILPFIAEPAANPSSLHKMGRFARSAIEIDPRHQYLESLCKFFEKGLSGISGAQIFRSYVIGYQTPGALPSIVDRIPVAMRPVAV
ncbi:MAG: hypothetical protein ACI845_000178 [Gammaproteobacteria bacterium]|jgi:hypothetical protein